MGVVEGSCAECLAEMQLMEDMELVFWMDPGSQPTLSLPHSSFPRHLWATPHPLQLVRKGVSVLGVTC